MPETPRNIEAEYAVISTLLLGVPGDWERARAVVGPDDFYRGRFARIFGAMDAVARSGIVPDAVTLCEHLASTGQVSEIDPQADVWSLLDSPLSGQNVVAWAKIVRDKADRRRAIDLARQMEEQARDPQFRAPKREMDDDYLTYAR